MSHQKNVIREMLGNERKFIWSPVANVTVTTRVKGAISIENFKQAVESLKKRHVLLSCRVTFDDRHQKAWFVSDNVGDIMVREVEGTNDKTWLDEVMEEYRTPFQITKGPLIRFVLVQFDDFVDIVVFAQHCICDGTALMYLTGDILGCISGPEKPIDESPLPKPLSPHMLPSAFAPSGLMGRLKRKGLNALNHSWSKNAVTFDQQNYEDMFHAYWEHFDYRILFMEMDSKKTSSLLKACREHKVTVNSALCTAFIGAHQYVEGAFKGTRRNVVIPVDLRNRVQPAAPGVLSLYVGGLKFPFVYNPSNTFWSNAKAFHGIVTKNMEKQNLFETFFSLEMMDHTLLEAMIFAGTAKYVQKGSKSYHKLSKFAGDQTNQANKMRKRFAKKLPGTIITNLGSAKILQKYGDLEILKMHFLPSANENLPLVLGAVTAANNLSLTVNFVDKDREPILKSILERALTLLRE